MHTTIWTYFLWILVLIAAVFTRSIFTKDECEFKKSWIGKWFQSGIRHEVYINSSYIETKGRCLKQDGDKYLLYTGPPDGCYSCMVIQEKHPSVLQYKEINCETEGNIHQVCDKIPTDAALYTLIRKYPEAKPVPCPFKGAPFTFVYSRGGDVCRLPKSRAESCTDDSRLVLKYQACADMQFTESAIEELICLATWKESSSRYLIGRIVQENTHRSVQSADEQQYRCFLYERTTKNDGRMTEYRLAQSGDATCNGLVNMNDGSRSIILTTEDNHHNRCKFPNWITVHHTWISLDHRRVYKFSQRNATLKITGDELDDMFKMSRPKTLSTSLSSSSVASAAIDVDNTFYASQPFGFEGVGFQSHDQKRPNNNEMRVVCHSEHEQSSAIAHQKVTIVAHVTAGCKSGFICMVFYKRDSNIIELQQSDRYVESPEEVCANFNTSTLPFTTLVTTNLQTKSCPDFGRYNIIMNTNQQQKRPKRQYVPSLPSDGVPVTLTTADSCHTRHKYESLAFGCTRPHEIDMHSLNCSHQPVNVFSCHGDWQDPTTGTYYIVTSPKIRRSNDPQRYCFIYTLTNGKSDQQHYFGRSAQTLQIGSGGGNDSDGRWQMTVVTRRPFVNDRMTDDSSIRPILKLSSVSDNCHRHIVPGQDGNWTLIFKSTGACTGGGATIQLVGHHLLTKSSFTVVFWIVFLLFTGIASSS